MYPFIASRERRVEKKIPPLISAYSKNRFQPTIDIKIETSSTLRNISSSFQLSPKQIDQAIYHLRTIQLIRWQKYQKLESESLSKLRRIKRKTKFLFQFLRNARWSTRSGFQDRIGSRPITWRKWSASCRLRSRCPLSTISSVTRCWASTVRQFLSPCWRFSYSTPSSHRYTPPP